MEESPKSPRIFTADEANKCIPRLVSLLDKVRQIQKVYEDKQLEIDIQELNATGDEGTLDERGSSQIQSLLEELEEVQKKLEEMLTSFEEIGCELKGVDPGLVDFYTLRDNELVYLCWKEGETEIRYWHPLVGGYASRQPL